MDGISGPASILAIAAAGLQISIKLVSFANHVRDGQDRMRYLGTDVSVTAGILQQLGELMQKSSHDNEHTTIFSKEGLLQTKASADACKAVFGALEEALRKGSRQLRRQTVVPGEQITLSKIESLRWPFLQPNLEGLRQELNHSRATLMLMLQVTTLAYSRKMAELHKSERMDREEQEIFIRSILSQHKHEAQQAPPRVQIPLNQKTKDQQGMSFTSVGYDMEKPSTPNPMYLPHDPLGPIACNQRTSRNEITGEQERSWDDPDYTSIMRKRRELPPGFADVQDEECHKRPNMPRATTQSHSFNTLPASTDRTDLQAWSTWPIVYPIYCGYNLRWSLSQIPVPENRVQRLMQRLSSADRATIKQRFEGISIKEREFLEAFIKGNLPSRGQFYEVNPA
ncbi:MAG: hypothetical protein Q9226_002309 [Calogaya cf. arnoldii]